VPDQTEPKDHGSTDEEDGEDEPGVGDINAVLDDDVDENMLENDIDDDDDDDIINRFNIVSEPDHDTDVEFDEEEDSEER
jgi:hypothetical protein